MSCPWSNFLPARGTTSIIAISTDRPASREGQGTENHGEQPDCSHPVAGLFGRCDCHFGTALGLRSPSHHRLPFACRRSTCVALGGPRHQRVRVVLATFSATAPSPEPPTPKRHTGSTKQQPVVECIKCHMGKHSTWGETVCRQMRIACYKHIGPC